MRFVPAWAPWMHVSLSMLGVLLYVASTHALHQRRHPAAAMSWIILMFFVPYLAVPAYVFFGQRKMAVRPADLYEPRTVVEGDGSGSWLADLLSSFGMSPPRAAPALRLHADAAEAERALFEVIESAQRRLFVVVYLVGDDRIGRAVLAALAACARRGVEVRLLLDGVGAFLVTRHRLRALEQAGGHVARAFPPMRRLLYRQANFRNHRKMVIADAAWLWMGGRNFADEYFAGRAGRAPWRDLTLDVRGAIADDAEAVFCADWKLATGETVTPTPLDPALRADPGVDAQLVASGPDHPQDVLQALLVTAAFRAQRRIVAATPYLIPDTSLLQALALAARRGVAVDIVLPRSSNHALADLARSRAIRELALSGVAVWLAPGMNHAKAVVLDDVALVGSANLDSRSLFLNFESTLTIYDPYTAKWVADWIDRSREGAVRYVGRPPSLLRDLVEGSVLWLGFQL